MAAEQGETCQQEAQPLLGQTVMSQCVRHLQHQGITNLMDPSGLLQRPLALIHRPLSTNGEINSAMALFLRSHHASPHPYHLLRQDKLDVIRSGRKREGSTSNAELLWVLQGVIEQTCPHFAGPRLTLTS